MNKYYSEEKNAQIIIFLLKQHKIKKVIASPGTTNMALVASMQNDRYFEMYSAVDERSAAYMACGLAEESGEPVVISCTGATASRNYISGLTEAYYRKLPILAITSMQPFSRVGHNIAQTVDRSKIQKDIANLSVELPIIKDGEDLWDCQIKVNQAMLALTHRGGGPVHINLPTHYSQIYDVKTLPSYKIIRRFTQNDALPTLPYGRVAIFIGSHAFVSQYLSLAIDEFCSVHNAVVFCDHTSSYKGNYRVQAALLLAQKYGNRQAIFPDLLIHIGGISGDYYTSGLHAKEVWRVSEDGKVCDTFRKLTNIFEMPSSVFFESYSKDKTKQESSYLQICCDKLEEIHEKIPELPLSNVWLASKMASLIPDNSTIHFGILNSLRAWNFFELPKTVRSMSNVGGFGIDGGLSSLIGASLTNPNKLYFMVIGDLAFFYDMNSIGNRHVGNNIRILLVNNGKGTEFRNFDHHAAQFGDSADEFIAAAGHYGDKSRELVKNYAENLGFKYMSATNKEEFKRVYKEFLKAELTTSPIIFEVFTDSKEESDALEKIREIYSKTPKDLIKRGAKIVLGKKGISIAKRFI